MVQTIFVLLVIKVFCDEYLFIFKFLNFKNCFILIGLMKQVVLALFLTLNFFIVINQIFQTKYNGISDVQDIILNRTNITCDSQYQKSKQIAFILSVIPFT